MRIKCGDCGHSEEVNAGRIVKLIGGGLVGAGPWAWFAYLFAGTGLALPICMAIVTGGAAMLMFKDEITSWIIKKGYKCNKCGGSNWIPTSDEIEREIASKEARILSLENERLQYREEATKLQSDLSQKEVEFKEYASKFYSPEEVDDLFRQMEAKESEIVTLSSKNEALEKLQKSFLDGQANSIKWLKKRFKACYSSLEIIDRAYKEISRLQIDELIELEKQFSLLQQDPQKAHLRDNIHETDVKEVGFGSAGRFYMRKEGGRFIIVCVGDKNSQNADLKYLKSEYK